MISKTMQNSLATGSVIRKMFEEGNRLRKQFGAENVFDFSLGNPDLEPPEEVLAAIRQIAAEKPNGLHGYMSNPGHIDVRERIAQKVAQANGVPVSAQSICMTVGAAGAMNVILKALIDPEDEVIVLAPYFVDYLNYIRNHMGKPVIVDNLPDSFLPDFQAISCAITPRTKAIIINSPNNPTGTLYTEEVLIELNRVLKQADHTIYVISDEPYAALTYDQIKAPPTLKYIDQCIICTSWSKTLSLPGERIGYLCIHPNCEDFDAMTAAVGQCNRMLGFVNAPSFFQRVVAQSLDAKVDIARYEQRRNRIFEILTHAGLQPTKPAGGLYFFIKAPNGDEEAFIQACLRQNILIVAGSGFGYKGYVRLCFAVPDTMIDASEQAFLAVGKELGLI